MSRVMTALALHSTRRVGGFTLACLLFFYSFAQTPAQGEQGPSEQRPGADVLWESRDLVITTSEGATHRFRVDVADTPKKRALGLMHRRSLAEDAGMLLTFPYPQTVSIWMKNTLIPLDILYIDRQGHIVQIVEDAVPLSEVPMTSTRPVTDVLEVAAGRVAHLGLTVGDKVSQPR